MKRVIELIKAEDYRQALVRLWVLASSEPTLVAWRLQRGSSEALQAATSRFRQNLQNQVAPMLDDATTSPLALIAALDEHVHRLGAPYNRASTAGRAGLVRLEEGNHYWLQPACLQNQWCSERGAPLDELSAWFKWHAVVPQTVGGLDVVVKSALSTFDDALARLAEQTSPTLKVWIAHFHDTADVQWDKSAAGDWRTTKVAPHDVRTASIEATMTAAALQGAHIVVFPEFTIDLAQRSVLVQQLKQGLWPSVVLVVAGSFHEEVDGQFYNTAPCYDVDGNPLWTHRKLKLFGNATAAEDAHVGSSLEVFSTPIGRLTVLICKDFMHDKPPLANLLDVVPVDWALVPSFGDDKTIRAHLARAKGLARRSNTHSVVAQTLNTAMCKSPPEQCVRGFGHGTGQLEPLPQVGLEGGLAEFALKFYPYPATPLPPALKRVK